MEQRVKRLYKASAEGSLTSLHDLLQEDEVILDRCTTISYAETPLHLAAMLGHFDFCSKLLTKKPELAGELDSRRSSALHLASAKGHVEIVKILLLSLPDMCLAEDADGNNPIHLAAMKGRVEVLKELVRVHPDAALAKVRICGGTILHLCVEYYQFEALKFLIEVLKNKELVNAKDDDGNCILHLAIANKQVEIIQYLITNNQIDVSPLNPNGLTALDLLIQTQRHSKHLQVLVHSLQLSSSQRSQQTLSSATISNNDQHLPSKNKYDQTSWLEKQRNSIMVVASLIATMAFQASISPSGGFWQDDSDTHKAGNSIWKDKEPGSYQVFLITNTIGFLSSLSIILFLVSGLPLAHNLFMWILTVIMWISISATALTYVLPLDSLFYLVEGWFDLMAFLILIHTIRFLSYRTGHWKVKRRVFFWIFMAIVYICVEGLNQHYYLVIGSVVFSSLVLALIVLITFLILQYVFLLISFLLKKMRSFYQVLKLYLDFASLNPIIVYMMY